MSRTQDQLFIPDFCGLRMVFSILLVGELLAFVLVLSPAGHGGAFWRDLALVSLFVQWVGLSSAGLLCLARPALRRLGNIAAGLLGYALVLVVTVALSEAAYWLIAQRIVEISGAPAWRVEPGNFWFSQPRLTALEPAALWHLEFVARNLAVSAIVTAVALRYFYVQHQLKSNLESEARSRIQALQSRIRPHFLFNSMNTIASLTRTHPELAEQVTEDLADLFRVSLGDAEIPATLAREIEVSRQYLRIEEQRLGDRMRVEWRVDALPGDATLPALSLQPIVENAVYHGIEPAPEGGVIEIEGGITGDEIRVSIANSCPVVANPRTREGHRMAQENVAQRFAAFFGERARLVIDDEGARYRITLIFPYRTETG